MNAYSEAIKEGYKPQINTGTATTSAATIDTLPGSKAIKLYNRRPDTAFSHATDCSTIDLSIPEFGEVDEYMEATKVMVKTDSGSAVYDLKAALRQ